MILVTGATGFAGRHLLRRLLQEGEQPRILLKPSGRDPALPRGLSVEAALTSLTDARGVRAAMVGIDVVIHLAGAEHHGSEVDLLRTDVQGTRNLAEAGAEAGVRQLIFVSHVGANRSSAYPVLRAKALAEEAIQASGVPHTIFRTGALFGRGDHLTESLALAAAVSPLVFFLPGDGEVLLHPLWVEDLLTLIQWTMAAPEKGSHIHEIGGPEFLSANQLTRDVLAAASITRVLSHMRPPYLRAAWSVVGRMLPAWPLRDFWIDYLAANRAAELNALPSRFGLQPARLEAHLDHIQGRNWTWEFVRRLFSHGRIEQ
ncbi:MAG: NAD(P)H-binding protein [Anaerolineales bacterium]|nr:NAD(P)H-binding protein [Anaerolineales bacterium]